MKAVQKNRGSRKSACARSSRCWRLSRCCWRRRAGAPLRAEPVRRGQAGSRPCGGREGAVCADRPILAGRGRRGGGHGRGGAEDHRRPDERGHGFGLRAGGEARRGHRRHAAGGKGDHRARPSWPSRAAIPVRRRRFLTPLGERRGAQHVAPDDLRRRQGGEGASEYPTAIERFGSLGDYEDAAAQKADCIYLYGRQLMREGQYQAACDQFMLVSWTRRTRLR